MLRRKSLFFLFLYSLFVFFYFHVLKRFPLNNDDDATFLLIAKDISQGNIFLNGWIVGGDDAFFRLTELLYVILVKVFGIVHWLVPMVKSLIYSGILCTAIWAIADGPAGRNGFGIIIVTTIFLFPTPFFTELLVDGIHWGALLIILFAILVLERFLSADRVSFPLLLGGISLILLGEIGDPIVFYLGTVPILLSVFFEITRVIGTKNKIRYVFLMATLILTTGLSHLFQYFLRHHSTLVFAKSSARFADPQQLGHNFSLLLTIFLKMFHADFFGKALFSSGTLVVLSGILLLLAVLTGFAKSGHSIIFHSREESFSTRAFFACATIDLFAFVFSNEAADMQSGRYLILAFFFMGILMARHWKKIRPPYISTIMLGAALILYSASNIRHLIRPHIAQDWNRIDLANYLEKNGLTTVYGSNHLSDINVDFNEKIRFRSILCFHSDLIPFFYGAKTMWYRNFGNPRVAQTVVLSDLQKTPETVDTSPLDYRCAVESFGPPERVADVGEFLVLSWKKIDYRMKSEKFLKLLDRLQTFSDSIGLKNGGRFTFANGIADGFLNSSIGYLPRHPEWSPQGIFLKEGECPSSPGVLCRFVGILGNPYMVVFLKSYLLPRYTRSQVLHPKHLWPYPMLGGTLEETSQEALLVELNPVSEKSIGGGK